MSQFPLGAIVQAGVRSEAGTTDKTVASLARNGVYRVDAHRAMLRQLAVTRDPNEVVAATVRRLEALRRAGIVQRVADGVWQVPDDLPQEGRKYDAQRSGDMTVELQSHLPIERQTRVIGATWLDRQLLTGAAGVSDVVAAYKTFFRQPAAVAGSERRNSGTVNLLLDSCP